MKTIIELPATHKKHIEEYNSSLQGDYTHGGYHEDDLEYLINAACELCKLEKKKRLTKTDKDLKLLLDTITPAIFQLADKCRDWSDNHRYPEMRKRMLRLEKKALQGDEEARVQYNYMVSSWRRYEPGRFQKINKP